jgi:hypothetical protein
VKHPGQQVAGMGTPIIDVERGDDMKTWKQTLAATAFVALVLPGAAFAQKANTLVVDGNDWIGASAIERRAFLVGAANVIIAEGSYAKRRNVATAPVSEGITRATQNMKLADIEARITRWYEANPGRLGTPVMGVVWQDIVKQQR